MTRTSIHSGPWEPASSHPDARQHIGYAYSEPLGAESASATTDEKVAAVSRYVWCSCGQITEPKRHTPPDASAALRVRRYRRHNLEVLYPEWEAHVSQWITEPIPGVTRSGRPADDELTEATEDDEEVEPGIDLPLSEAIKAAASEIRRVEAEFHELREKMRSLVHEGRSLPEPMTWEDIRELTGASSRQAAQDRWKQKGA